MTGAGHLCQTMMFSIAMLLMTGVTAFTVFLALRALEWAARTTGTVTLNRLNDATTALDTSLGELGERTVSFQEDPTGRSCST